MDVLALKYEELRVARDLVRQLESEIIKLERQAHAEAVSGLPPGVPSVQTEVQAAPRTMQGFGYPRSVSKLGVVVLTHGGPRSAPSREAVGPVPHKGLVRIIP